MNEENSCCAPTREGKRNPHDRSSGKQALNHYDQISLPAGEIRMGSNYEKGYIQDGEGLTGTVSVSPFLIDAQAVTNGQFRAFVEETGYVTEAEEIGWSFVFAGLLPDDFEDTRGVQATPWWRQVFGASWIAPEGPHSTIQERLDHPVVQVSWNDAVSYANWQGGRLPTEAEWEYAASAGLRNPIFPWGDELEPDGKRIQTANAMPFDMGSSR